MSEEIRFLVKELNKEPFKKNFTYISFDSLKPEGLLLVLNDVLGEVDPANRVDMREEDPEGTIARLLHSLRILKYRPPEGAEDDPGYLRNGIISASSSVIYPILTWALPRVDELKTRAYLAKFLVKVDVPQDQRADIEVEELFQQYEEKIEEFKVAHKQLESLKGEGGTTGELIKDISAMEEEGESVTRKIERLKTQVESTPNLAPGTMEVVQRFRKEREKMKELGEQGQSQTLALNQAEGRVSRLQRQLKEIQGSGMGATPEGILQRLEQDVDVARYIVNSKLPKEIESRRKQVGVIESVLSDSAMSGRDLEDISSKIERIRVEVNEMLMRRMMKTEDEKLLMFRQQSAIVCHRKEGLVEKLNESRGELLQVKEEVREKRQIIEAIRGEAGSVKEEDFKEYVKGLRIKSTRYKQMKAELGFFKSESGVLSKTIFILEEGLKNTTVDLAALEARLGVKGFSADLEALEKLSSQKAELDVEKSKNLEEMTMTVQELHDKITVKKIDLAPLVKKLNSMRQSVQMVGHEHDASKRKYDGVAASVEATLRNLTKELDDVRGRCEEDEKRYCRYKALMVVYKVELKRMGEELKIYTGVGGAKKKPFKDQLLAKISEQEKMSKGLKEEERRILENTSNRVNQAVMWKDLCKLFECKIKLREMNNAMNENPGF